MARVVGLRTNFNTLQSYDMIEKYLIRILFFLSSVLCLELFVNSFLHLINLDNYTALNFIATFVITGSSFVFVKTKVIQYSRKRSYLWIAFLLGSAICFFIALMTFGVLKN
jgi:hypothetical protein